MSTIADYRARVLSVVQDTRPELTQTAITGDIDRAILAALAQFQQARPRERVVQVTGTGTFDYALDGGSPIVSDWKPGLSAVVELIYPWATTDQRPPRLEADDYAEIVTNVGRYLRFLNAQPSTAEKFLLTYSTVHTVDASSSTVNEADEEALIQLSAAHTFRKLAAVDSTKIDSQIQADSANRTMAEVYLTLARHHESVYKTLMGGGDVPVGVGVALDSDPSFQDQGRSPLLFHSTRGH